jgi:DNA-binding NtrC family response regulator
MASTILIVTQDNDRLAGLLWTLDAAGYRARGASTFAEAKQRLGDQSPDLLIADERLGAFNGLHVILRARTNHPEMKAIVTSHCWDEGLEIEAKRLDVECVVRPTDAAEWLTAISRTLNPANTTDPLVH